MHFAGLCLAWTLSALIRAVPLPEPNHDYAHALSHRHSESNSHTSSSLSNLERRTPTAPTYYIPTVEETKPHLDLDKKIATGKKNKGVLFYSGPSEQDPKTGKMITYQDRARDRAARTGRIILEDSWKDMSYPERHTAGKTPQDEKKFWINSSKAIAQKTTGPVAKVLLPVDMKGTEFHNGTIWKEHEYQELVDNEHVRKIVKLNPENEKEELLLESEFHQMMLACADMNFTEPPRQGKRRSPRTPGHRSRKPRGLTNN
ncbi:hypothetical protein H0H93_001971 [Arthromyces matolae]|nr:hypothetical protein H0H93_001971 [Arthromyces matolae]